MLEMKQRISILLLLLVAITSVLAASPPSFCKCTCFSNSTIIPLNSAPEKAPTTSKAPSSENLLLRSLFSFSSSSPLSPDTPLVPRTPKTTERTCADCNRQFCLDYNLPICKDVKLETDVFATCFQRDSVKDQIIVYVFMLGTLGLLVWAGVRPWVEVWYEKVKGRHSYNPVAN